MCIRDSAGRAARRRRPVALVVVVEERKVLVERAHLGDELPPQARVMDRDVLHRDEP